MPFTETGRVKPDDDESDDEEPPALDDADSSDEEEDDDDDSEVPEMKVRDEAILSDDESEGDYDDMTEGKPVSRRTVEVHLHEIIRDEMIGESHAFEVNHGHWETIEPQFMNAYEVNAKSRRVRRKTPTNEACDTMASSTRKVREGTNIMKKFKEGWFKGTVMELPKGLLGLPGCTIGGLRYLGLLLASRCWFWLGWCWTFGFPSVWECAVLFLHDLDGFLELVFGHGLLVSVLVEDHVVVPLSFW